MPKESLTSDSLALIRISPSSTVGEAMLGIDQGGARIALAVDEEEHLVGIVTDGDIRRALLAENSLESPVEPHLRRDYFSVGPEVGRAEVLDLMQANLMTQVPIIDRERKLLGLHLLHEILGARKRTNWAVIMAGGKGTRLRPLTDNIPKPMIKVAGRPILERLLLHLVGFGFRKIFLSINYLGHIIEDHFQDGARHGCQIEYLRESDSMGTGGSLSLLPEKPQDPILLVNGDIVTQANLDRMIAFHEKEQFDVTIGTRRYYHQVPFGCLRLENSRVSQLEEKPILERVINAGIYLISPQVLDRIPNQQFDITDLFDSCLEDDLPIGAFEIEEDWIDVGQREQLREAQEGTAE